MVLVPTLLNVNGMPRHTAYRGQSHTLYMYTFLLPFQRVMESLAHIGQAHGDTSFGIAMAAPQFLYGAEQPFYDWDNPRRLVWFAGGWGHEEDFHTANAVRSLRPLARTGRSSTLAMAHQARDGFLDPVPSEAGDANFQWGDNPHGGGVQVRFLDLCLLGAVSGLEPQENETVARLILDCLATEIYVASGLKL